MYQPEGDGLGGRIFVEDLVTTEMMRMSGVEEENDELIAHANRIERFLRDNPDVESVIYVDRFSSSLAWFAVELPSKGGSA